MATLPSSLLTREAWLNTRRHGACARMPVGELSLRDHMKLLLLLALVFLPPQDPIARLVKVSTPTGMKRPGYVPGSMRAATWFDGLRAYGSAGGIDVLNDPRAIERLLR